MANGGSISQIPRQILIDALNRLGDLLGRRGLRLELVCYGGTVCVLFHRSREMTHDVDAIFPKDPYDREILESLIEEVAGEFNLEYDDKSRWFNDSVSVFAAPTDSGVSVFEHPYLVLKAADWHEMLALKLDALQSGRHIRSGHHLSDAVVFLKEIGRGDKEVIFQRVFDLKSFYAAVGDTEFKQRFDLVWDEAFGQS